MPTNRPDALLDQIKQLLTSHSSHRTHNANTVYQDGGLASNDIVAMTTVNTAEGGRYLVTVTCLRADAE